MEFSIIIPIFNVEKYLFKCIDSVLKQTFEDFEIILVNDGSSDGSKSICDRFASQDNRIKVLDKGHGGTTSTRKKGVLEAKGEYIVCVDGDDFISNDLLLSLHTVISNNNHPDMIAYGYFRYNENTAVSAVFQPSNQKLYTKDELDLIKSKYLFDNAKGVLNCGSLDYSLCTKAVKREIFKKHQMTVPDHIKNGEDNLLVAKMLCDIKTLYILEYCGYYYRVNLNSTTRIRTAFDLENVLGVKEELEKLDYLPTENIEIYYYNSLFILLKDMAIISKSYNDFKNNFISSLDVQKKATSFKHLDYKTIIKFYLIIHKHWFMFYRIAKKRHR